MTLVVLCLLYAATTTALAPLILTRGRWQVWRPRLALACWHAALASSAGALVFSAIYSMALAHSHGQHGRGSHALMFSLASWAGAFVLAACCALLLGRSEPVVRREHGVKEHLRYAALTCRQSVEERAGITIRYVETESPVAYSFHAPEATIVLSSSLRKQLSEQELDAIIAHERAHLNQNHHLALRVANINAAALPGFPPARRLKNSTEFLVELIADDVAATQCGSEPTESALTVMAQLAARPELALRADRLRSRGEGARAAVSWARLYRPFGLVSSAVARRRF